MKRTITFLLIAFCSLAVSAQLETHPGEYTIKNLKINTKESDFGTAFLGKDKVIFAAPTSNTMIVRKTWKENGQQFLDLYTGLITDDRQVIDKKRMPGDVNTKYHEAGVSVTKDLKTIYYTANNYYEKQYLTDSSGVNNLQMFRASLSYDGKWTEKEKLPFNDTEYSIGHPALNHDDTKLYFVSDGPESMGKTDIFVVDLLKDEAYGEPENLGPKINSYEREVYPYMDEESVLYFASDKLTEGEKLNVFATRVVDDEPGVPVKLDVSVSSSREEYVAAFKTFDSESLRLADEGAETNVIAMTEADQRDFDILVEAERLAEIENSERPSVEYDTSHVYDFEGERIIYTVQIGAFLDHVNNDVYGRVSDLFSHEYQDGYNRFYSGIFASEEEARAHLKQMREEGFGDAFVLGLKGKNRFFPE